MISKEKIYVPIFVAFIPCLLIFPSYAFTGAANAVNLCIGTLIPSLFAFMVISETIITLLSGKRIPFCLFSRILKVERSAEAAILLSFIGGYPIGVRCISSLYDNGLISKGNASRLALCLVNPSPCFIISAVGMKMLGSLKAGIILAVSVYLANILVSLGLVFFRDLYEFSRGPIHTKSKEKQMEISASSVLVESVSSSSLALLYICMFTVFFGTVSGVFSAFVKSGWLRTAIDCILEVTIGCSSLTSEGFISLPIFAAVLCFGGLCVMLQIICFGRKLGISPMYYLVTRGIAAILSYIFARALSVFYTPEIAVFSNTDTALSPQSDYGFFSAILVMFAAVVFVLSTSKNVSKTFKNRS